LYLTMSNVEKPSYGRIGRATASSPLGPWKVDPQPVLLPGEHGQWDAGGVGEAFVIQTSNGYAMYYTSGYPYTKIGLATSRDGISWTKYDDPLTLTAPFTGSDPVLKADQAWEVNELGSPSVQRVGERWIMAYTVGSGNGIGYSVSADGVHWIKSSNNPIIERNDDKGITWVNASRLISCQSEVCLYFGAKLEGAAESIVYIATWREP
jgi:predicted GH43/DUF377 family glycosyl hydrolase